MPLKQGATLRHRYRIEEILGQGGMGAVYRAEDINLGVEVAVKENLFTTQDYARQFRREATILASLRHPNLPRVTDHFVIEDEGQYLVMDYIEGEDLREILEREGPLPEAKVLPWFLEICDALAYLHSRTPPIVHRDIKPGNIKINPDGKALLVDFGLAKVYEEGGETTTGAKAMTPGFSPPEQYGSGRTDTRTDIYSLAATLYTALTATIPEDSLERAMGRANLTGIRQRSPSVGVALANAVEQGLALDPEKRYQSMRELADALASSSSSSRPRRQSELPYLQQTQSQAARTVVASPMTRIAEPPEKRRRWPIYAVLAVAAVAILAGALFALPGEGLGGLFGGGVDRPTNSVSPEPEATEISAVNTTATTDPELTSQDPSTNQPEPTDPASGQPTPTPQGGGVGQIAFASNRDGLPQIYLMNVDGTDISPLTQMADGACQPAWSPDGSKIAFTSPCRTSQNQYPGASVWVINSDGSGLKPLSSAPGGDFDPDWSPDGDRIAFSSLENGWPQVFVMQADGSGRTLLSQGSGHESDPSWSPSGDQLIFISTRSGVAEVWVMTADGSDAKRFSRSAGRDNHRPGWSPDGTLVTFDQEISGVRRLVVLQYKEGGSPEVRICPEGPLSEQPMAEPDWSPDGRWLVFETWPDGADHNIAILTKSCANYAELTEEDALDFDAAWRP
ncbi:MAG: protein kinase domain-containing protein [Anaerolineales bacterium]